MWFSSLNSYNLADAVQQHRRSSKVPFPWRLNPADVVFDDDEGSDDGAKADDYDEQGLFLADGEDGEDTWDGNECHVECKVSKVVSVLDRPEL